MTCLCQYGEKLKISAPFGNYFKVEGVTSTLGTYTLHRRAGLLNRLWRVLSTVRYLRRPQAWINNLGLPSPEIGALKTAKNHILSIHGFNSQEWTILNEKAIELNPIAIELNISCPNIEHRSQVLKEIQSIAKGKIVKLPPYRWMDLGIPLYDMGVRCFHLCNTIATPGGGISGKPLKQYSLWAIKDFRDRWGDEVHLIGGGGITETKDIDDYLDAGANNVAIGSTLLNPLNWGNIKVFRDYIRKR